ncbi:PREDICTED: protein trichome birefringence-like 43 [Tarenaya hassleriana]|uniref:protein trichome birefringence-like 43 n=1 Tax=Tarenaya hassleriana TaxID=28532 RepID=UPI00053C5540|nr:PREDICTED: protein trichome birefringence-like 43 [Tarenaya hassleriana]
MIRHVAAVFAVLTFVNVMANGEKGCDLYKGDWVLDESYPLYDSDRCGFIERQFNCKGSGRPDTDYLRYRWQPSNGCVLPRFDGRDFLRRMKGKSLMFVGDSLSLNQWQSLTCMLHTSVPNATFTSKRFLGLSTFTFPAYKARVKFSRNAFLVDIVGKPPKRVLKLDSISSGSLWKTADVLVFNSWHWWLHTGRKQPWDMMEEGNVTVTDMDRLVAYEKALRTWAKWVDENVDPSRTQVFFQGVSPDHANSNDWSEPGYKGCRGETTPLMGSSSYPAGSHPAEMVAEKVIGEMKNKVKLLDVTFLSQLRKDGHPSVFGLGGHRVADCSHWCLAGVPDTWNQLLYAELSH